MVEAKFITDDIASYYEVIEKIGEGRMAKVFKARRRSDSKLVALKFVSPSSISQRDLVFNEVNIMVQRSENEGIVRIFDCFDFKDRLYIFMELM